MEFYESLLRRMESEVRINPTKSLFLIIKKVMGLLNLTIDLSSELEQIKILKSQIDQNELTFRNILDNLPEHIYWLNTKNNFFRMQ